MTEIEFFSISAIIIVYYCNNYLCVVIVIITYLLLCNIYGIVYFARRTGIYS